MHHTGEERDEDFEDLSSEAFLKVLGPHTDLARYLNNAIEKGSPDAFLSPGLRELMTRDNLKNLSKGLYDAIHEGTVDLADLEPLLIRLERIASRGYPKYPDDSADDTVEEGAVDLVELESLLKRLGQIANQGRAVSENIMAKDRIYSQTALTGLKTELAKRTFSTLEDFGEYLNAFAKDKELRYVSVGVRTLAQHVFGQKPQIEVDVANEKYGVTITDDGRLVTFLKVDDYWVMMGFPNMD